MRAIAGRRPSKVERSKGLPSARRWQVCDGALIRDRVPVSSWVASSCQRRGSGCRSCQAKSGTSQFLERRTWLHASNEVTK